jgi:soluble lytic murein transglycosylase-like protein
MTPAFPRRLTLGLLPTAVLLTVALGFGGSASSESTPMASRLLPLRLDLLFPELATSAVTAPAPAALPNLSAATAPASRPAKREMSAARPKPLGGARRADRYLLDLPYGLVIRAVAREHHLDGLLLASVIEAESSFRPDAVSPRGALGLMQLMPLHLVGVDRPLDPQVNLELGAGYLARLERRFGGDLELALAAYHAGPTAVERWGRIPEDGSTPQYVERVLGLYREHQASLAGGVAELR